MGYPRYLTVPPDSPGVYHCTSRCVRRAFLCGDDPVSGRSFEHRRRWVEHRILELAKVFAVAVHAYAVMSNHFHVVLEVDPATPRGWSDAEVARRWLSLSMSASETSFESRVAALLARPERLKVLRERLGSLSWFMRYLKEPIARRANREDGCTGRFWEGRFGTQDLLDDAAVLACMVYVDLNPVRAGLAGTAQEARYTSVRRRLRGSAPGHQYLSPLASSIDSRLVPLSSRQYLELVDWTAHSLHPVGSGFARTVVPPGLDRIEMRPRQWLLQVAGTESRYWRAIGCVEALISHARNTGRRWLRGIGAARVLEKALEPI